jgi:hypothetical protein
MKLSDLDAPKRKYGNVPTEYDGITYDSAAEARYAQQLDIRMKAKDIVGWGRQQRIPLVVNRVRICTMVVDFWICHRDHRRENVEIKGFETAVYKLKRKLFEALTGEELTVVRSKDVG